MDSKMFRDLLGAVPTPVTIVTTLHDGEPHGTTVSAFCSVSLRPPLVLVALDESSHLLAHLRETRAFGINVLGRDQEALALHFARKGVDRFTGVPWVDDRGQPRLEGSTSWMVCDLVRLVTGGDHQIALGYVVHGEYSRAAPLVYQAREFGTHSRFALEDAS